MDKLFSQGPTIFMAESTIWPESKVTISFLSKRAYKFILRRSLDERWERPISAIIPPIGTWSGEFHIVAFQPHTGSHIIIKGDQPLQKLEFNTNIGRHDCTIGVSWNKYDR